MAPELTREEIDKANALRSMEAAGIKPGEAARPKPLVYPSRTQHAIPVPQLIDPAAPVTLTPAQMIAARVVLEGVGETVEPDVRRGVTCTEFRFVVAPITVAALLLVLIGYAQGNEAMAERGIDLLLATVVAYPVGRSIVKAFASQSKNNRIEQ